MTKNRKTLIFYEAPLAETIEITIERSILSGNGIDDGGSISGPNLSRRRIVDDEYDYDY